MSQQILKKNWQPLPQKILVSSIPEEKGNELGYKKFRSCEACNGLLIEDNCCTECKHPVDLICMSCGKKTMYDSHEFCYCQLEALTASSLWKR